MPVIGQVRGVTIGWNWLVVGIACLCGAIAIANYPGDRFVFSVFSAIIFLIAYLSVRYSDQYSHLFLGIIFFVGFWLKYLFHQVLSAAYFEPHGAFDGAPASWDMVFYVASIGGAGYVAGRLISLRFVTRLSTSLYETNPPVPAWWGICSNYAWILVCIAVVGIVLTNQELGLFVRGHVARFIPPWPLGGLFAWMADIGLALIVGLFLVWDRRSGHGAIRGFAVLCFEGALVSVSTLSRGVYFFHTVPALITETRATLRQRRFRAVMLLCALWVAIGVAVPAATTFQRLFGENVIPNTQEEMTRSESSTITRSRVEGVTVSSMWNQFVTLAQILVVDRWTGLEGLMATVAYPDRNFELFGDAARFRRSYGTVDVYTKKISGSVFGEENAKKYHFASPAGPVAFFFFSGSLIVVFLGMAALSLLMSVIELGWLWLVRDRILLALSGLYLALVILQLSGSLVQAATGPAAVTALFALFWWVGRLSPPAVFAASPTATASESNCTKN